MPSYEGRALKACRNSRASIIPQWKKEDVTIDFIVGLPEIRTVTTLFGL